MFIKLLAIIGLIVFATAFIWGLYNVLGVVSKAATSKPQENTKKKRKSK